MIPNVVLATVVGSSNMSLQIPSGGTISSKYNYSPNQYGRLKDSNISTVTTYLDSTYNDETTNGVSTVRGSYDSSSGAQSFSFEANSSVPSATNTGSVSVDLFASTYYTGTLSSFSYIYDFLGAKDNASDRLWLIIQMQIAYRDDDNKWVNVYSDYTTNNYAPDLIGSDIFKTKMTSFRDDSNIEVNISDTVVFDDYSSYGPQKWWFRYDFMGGGTDREGDNQSSGSIPEPSTLALIGLGLAGISYRRKKTA